MNISKLYILALIFSVFQLPLNAMNNFPRFSAQELETMNIPATSLIGLSANAIDGKDQTFEKGEIVITPAKKYGIIVDQSGKNTYFVQYDSNGKVLSLR